MARDKELDSRRLKAARALRAISVSDLAKTEALRRNGISANLIGETERKDREARPMELRVIADALGLPAWFFETELNALHEAPADVAKSLAEIHRKLDQLLDALEPATPDATPLVLPPPPGSLASPQTDEAADTRERKTGSSDAPPRAGQQ